MLFVFAIGTANAQTPIYEFNFNNTMANTFGSGSISPWTEVNVGGFNSVAYVVDRNGQANSAINIPSTTSFTANAPLLPQLNNARTISFWVKFIGDTDNKIFPIAGWGSGVSNQAFGFWRNGVQNTFYTWGAGNDYTFPSTNAQQQAVNNGWVHIAMTYFNATTLTIYYNGSSLGNYNRILNTTGTVLSLNRLVNGSVGTATATQIDDLKIYDTALTAAQVLNLYNPNALGNSPVISNVSNSSPTSNSAFINFSLNPGGTTTTTSISVTALGAGIGSVFNGPTASGNTTQQLSYNITGLNPETCYTFRVIASNSASTQQSPTQMFCTNDANFNKTPIYHFEFNGNTQEKRDASLAFGNPNSGFVNNTAIRLNNNVQAINLPFLPQGFKPRTVAIKVFFESGALSQTNNVFSYGTATTSQSFGYDQETAIQANHYFWSNDNIFSNPVNFGTYYTMVFVYDGLDTRIYKDGIQVDISSNTPNTAGTIFRLGRTTTGLGGFFNGRVDDLRIYNDTLSATEVAALGNSLSNESFSNNNLKFSLYPNPSNSILNVDLSNELKLVEIYSLGGQKVLSSMEKRVNISNLSSGIYMIRVQDVDGNVATQKLMKE